MSRTDMIADSLTCIRNAGMVKKTEGVTPYSLVLMGIFQILKDQGYIENFRQIDENKKHFIKVYLRYQKKENRISGIKRISKPSRRRYTKASEVPYVLKGRGLAVLSTPQGLLTDRQARQKAVGGEVLFYIW